MERLVLATGLGAVLAAVGAGMLFANGDQTTSQTTESDARFGNVVLTVPGLEAGLHVGYNPPQSSEHEWVIQVYADEGQGPEYDEWPTLEIDPTTGAILSDTLSSVEPGLVQSLVASIRVVGADERAGWPYEGADANAEPLEVGGSEVPVPDRLSGISTYLTNALCQADDEDCSPRSVAFLNERSRVSIDLATGAVLSSSVHPADQDAFEELVRSTHP